ncbi:MAG: hypothetical protein AB1489_37010 [Acidobacteriota bacterium]
MPDSGQLIDQEIKALEREIASLQEQLQSASLTEKPRIIAQIKQLLSKLKKKQLIFLPQSAQKFNRIRMSGFSVRSKITEH